jgi:hypothetical protein
MRSLKALAIMLALVAAACGSSADAPQTTTPTGVATTQPPGVATSTTQPPGDATSTTGTEPDGPLAPDFTLALGDGSEFVLSAEQKPVYMVFWAEW